MIVCGMTAQCWGIISLCAESWITGYSLRMWCFCVFLQNTQPKAPGPGQAPSPYQTNWNTRSTGTPSPMSPQPSPAGSVGSVGSVVSYLLSYIHANVSHTPPPPNEHPLHPNTCLPPQLFGMAILILGVSFVYFIEIGYRWGNASTFKKLCILAVINKDVCTCIL